MAGRRWEQAGKNLESSQRQFLPGSLPIGLLILGEASHRVIRTLML